MQTIRDLRIALREGAALSYRLSCHVDVVSYQLELNQERRLKSDHLADSLHCEGTLSAFGKHPLDGLRCVVTFQGGEWWAQLMQRVGLDANSQAVGILEYPKPSAPLAQVRSPLVYVCVAATTGQLVELHEATSGSKTNRAGSLGLEIELDLEMSERDAHGEELNWLWVRRVNLGRNWLYSIRNYNDPDDRP